MIEEFTQIDRRPQSTKTDYYKTDYSKMPFTFTLHLPRRLSFLIKKNRVQNTTLVEVSYEDPVHITEREYNQESICGCDDPVCHNECGILTCGCIDICRGRCDSSDYDASDYESD